MDLGAFDFRTGKMLMSKMNKSRQRVRYDSSNQVKVSRSTQFYPVVVELRSLFQTHGMGRGRELTL